MTNHFRSAMSKLTTEEVSALTAPLMAVLHASTEDGADVEAATEFIDRYTTAMSLNGHELIWIASNGRRFDQVGIEDEPVAEVVGFQHNPQPGRPGARRPEPWRGLAAHITGGRMGLPGDDFILTVVGFTPSTVVVAEA